MNIRKSIVLSILFIASDIPKPNKIIIRTAGYLIWTYLNQITNNARYLFISFQIEHNNTFFIDSNYIIIANYKILIKFR